MKYFYLVLLSIFSVVGISVVYADNIRTDLSENLLRLHIIANSDSEFDQSVKLSVRDAILESAKDNPERKHIETIVANTLTELNAGYGFNTEITQTFVPEKTYKNIRLPEGTYNCINITLGNGNGKNWWCVAYPPLCFTEEVFGELSQNGEMLLEGRLDRESFKTIIYNDDVNVRFWIVDEFIKLKNRLW